MKKIALSKKMWIWIGSCLIFCLMALGFAALRGSLIRRQTSQQMAERWNRNGDSAQISCFFSPNAGVTEQTLLGFGYTLDAALEENSIVLESQNESARLWTHTYSAPGFLTVKTNRSTMTNVRTIGVGGDFFAFHPQKLVYGNYFSSSDLNQDYIILDEEAAWKLYGGSNIAGLTVEVGGRPLVIAGVIERPKGKMEKAAGLTEPVVYVALEVLEKYGSSQGINHYEVVMPNPIKNFAMTLVKEKLSVNENETVMVENTGRYSFFNNLKILKEFSYRSMNGKAIIYPYWENLARGYEDKIAIAVLLMLLCMVYPVVSLSIYLLYRWRHKKWTWESLGKKIRNRMDDLADKIRTGQPIGIPFLKKKKKTAMTVYFEEDEHEKS